MRQLRKQGPSRASRSLHMPWLVSSRAGDPLSGHPPTPALSAPLSNAFPSSGLSRARRLLPVSWCAWQARAMGKPLGHKQVNPVWVVCEASAALCTSSQATAWLCGCGPRSPSSNLTSSVLRPRGSSWLLGIQPNLAAFQGCSVGFEPDFQEN